MIEQQGRVTRTGGGQAWVLVGPSGGCAACASGQGCGAGLLGRLLRRRPVELTVPDSQGLRVGQAVMLGVPEAVFLGMVMRMYGWPLLSGLALAAFSHHIAELYEFGRAWVDVASLGGLLAGGGMALAWRRIPGERQWLEGKATMLRAVHGRPCRDVAAGSDPGTV